MIPCDAVDCRPALKASLPSEGRPKDENELAGTATSSIFSDAGFPSVAAGSGSSPPADGSYGLVHGGFVREGFGIFGWDIVRPEYRILVMFVPPAGCTPPLAGDLMATCDCAGIPAEGEISGGGTTADGDPLVGVALGVSKACYEALETGARWPSALPECR